MTLFGIFLTQPYYVGKSSDTGPGQAERSSLKKEACREIQDRGGQVARRPCAVVIIIDGHDLAVAPDDRANVADVSSAGVVATRHGIDSGLPPDRHPGRQKMPNKGLRDP